VTYELILVGEPLPVGLSIWKDGREIGRVDEHGALMTSDNEAELLELADELGGVYKERCVVRKREA